MTTRRRRTTVPPAGGVLGNDNNAFVVVLLLLLFLQVLLCDDDNNNDSAVVSGWTTAPSTTGAPSIYRAGRRRRRCAVAVLPPLGNAREIETARTTATTTAATAPRYGSRRRAGKRLPSPVLPVARRRQEEDAAGEETGKDSSPPADEKLEGDGAKKRRRRRRHVVVVGAGWAGLSAAYAALSSSSTTTKVTLVDAAPRVGGLVRDGYVSGGSRNASNNNSDDNQKKKYKAEAGQHGFWENYRNVFRFLRTEPCFRATADDSERETKDPLDRLLTGYAEQGQYSPKGLEAVWPVYRDQNPELPTGLAQLAYTRFLSLPGYDRLSALPLVVAFSEYDPADDDVVRKYDETSFYDLCRRLGVTRRCYDEAFEPMILTGLFAPGRECSASAALGMAYFFVLQSQAAFDVRWCRGNVGDVVFTPWIRSMVRDRGLKLESSTRVTDFDIDRDGNVVRKLRCTKKTRSGREREFVLEPDQVILAVGATALAGFVRTSRDLASYPEFRRFANLRGTSVLATRIYLDRNVTTVSNGNDKSKKQHCYSANACWGFDRDVGMTFFDIRALHGDDAPTVRGCPGSVLEVDYYYANQLLVMSDDDLVAKVKNDLDTILGKACERAQVVDAAVIRLPNAVNWYFPGSYKLLPDLESRSIRNLYFAGDIARSPHGSWSQEKAFVTGRQAANLALGRPRDDGVLPIGADEVHVKLGKELVVGVKTVLGLGDPTKAPSLVDIVGGAGWFFR